MLEVYIQVKGQTVKALQRWTSPIFFGHFWVTPVERAGFQKSPSCGSSSDDFGPKRRCGLPGCRVKIARSPSAMA